MEEYQSNFIQFAIDRGVLRFGEFTLKSGRLSPYFFNSGLFSDGRGLFGLGCFYVDAIRSAQLEYDILFGPAYKGIPLVSAVAMVLAENKINKPYCCNRKEAKDHGEEGVTFGSKLEGKALIIDDVISSGSSIEAAIEIIKQAGAEVAATVVALDRQEKGKGGLSATQEVERYNGIHVISIVKLEDIIEFLKKMPAMSKNLDNIKRYQDTYGVG